MLLSLDEILFDEEPHVYRFKGKEYPSVTQVIRRAGLGECFSAVPQDRMEYAQRRGRMVHLACQYVDENDLNWGSIDASIHGYVQAYIRFLKECPIVPVAIERRMVDVKLGIAGTPDLICFLRGQRAVVDRKTSQVMGKSMGLQTAGYKILWNAINPTQPVRERYGLRLEKTGKYRLVPHERFEDEEAFQWAVRHARSEMEGHQWRQIYAAH